MLFKIYNPNWTNVTNVEVLMETANSAAEGWLVQGFIIGLFFVFLMNFQFKYGFLNGLIASGWICFIISLVAVYGGLTSLIYPLLFLALAAFGILYKVIKKE